MLAPLEVHKSTDLTEVTVQQDQEDKGKEKETEQTLEKVS